MRASNATQEILAHFIPPIASTSLDFDPVREEIGCQADDIGVSSSAHDKASITQIRRESIRFDFDPMWEEIECQADDIGALAKKKQVRSDAACQCLA